MQGLHRGRAGALLCALGLIAWSCSADEHDFDRPSQLGDAGDGGEPAIAGAGGADTTVNGGVGAETAGGTVSEAGGGSQSEELSVVTTSPADIETGTERDAVVEVTFSAAIDPASVTDETFRVTGPTGVVDGTLSVEGATVTFAPSAPWALLADYEVEVAATVSAADAGKLGAAYRFEFQSRDGVFGKPVRLTAEPIYLSQPVANRQGHVLVGWSAVSTLAHSVVLYDPHAGKWGTVMPLQAVGSADVISYALNENGEGIVFVGPSSGTTSSLRWNGSAWGVPKSIAGRGTRHSLLADDGSAMAMWETLNGDGFTLSTATISAADTWGPTTPLHSKARSRGLGHFGSGYLALFATQPDDQDFYRRFEAGAWGAEKPSFSATGVDFFAFDTQDASALATWIDQAPHVQASHFDGASWETTSLGSADYGVGAAVGGQGALATWFYELVAYAAVYESGSGWLDPVRLGAAMLGSTDHHLGGPAAQIDDAGNSLAAWPDGSSITWRRAPRGQDWLDPQMIKDQDAYYLCSTSDAAGNVMLVWSNPLGVWASRFE